MTQNARANARVRNNARRALSTKRLDGVDPELVARVTRRVRFLVEETRRLHSECLAARSSRSHRAKALCRAHADTLAEARELLHLWSMLTR